METYNKLNLGEKYSKKLLSTILEEPNLKFIREGIYHCKNSNSTFFFVDLEKVGKEERFHFNDFYDGEYFHWDSQTTQHIDSPRIKEIIAYKREPLLFARVNAKLKSKTQPFIYCGRLKYIEYEKGTSKPVHMIYNSIDYNDFTEIEELIDIYLWKPESMGKKTSSKIVKRKIVTNERKGKFKKPNQTERTGLVTSRVGQGYYRQQILEKWNGTCPITKCNTKEILISSHIVPWRESNDIERLDPDNGILLTPNVDALFDRNLISFDENGKIIFSSSLTKENIIRLGLNIPIHIKVNDGMKKYLSRHRKKLYELH